ncbi:Predicted membrane protein [Pasteurella multocida]|uniref:DNA gyrase subunit B n=1 Tax=Pasteurella dagmatis ATCC 43325 TaxID=667128 RepID=C9PNT7_9PAST|nr:hypothetical protein [Pasteurella dagmatis]EEX50728.1 hypothetical protein HMPREF0621_0669 [Pasteurella dagmatis ATCC 43325]SNV77990.1 Predicted membrane protein [Pasteurella dagmatis]VEI58485.1 Predicted membrane protein [Pasteurella multocida]
MNKLANLLLSILIVAYPFLIFFSLDRLPLNAIVTCLFALFILRLLFVFRAKKQINYLKYFALLSAILGCVLSLFALVSQSENSLLFYPVIMNIIAFVIFGFSLLYPPSIIELFARLVNKNLPDQAINYTRNVTITWCIFFIINGSIAFITVLSNDLSLWTWYNGLISYILMGILFIIEFCIRQYVKRKLTH